MTRRILSLVLAGMLLLAMTACGEKQSQTDPVGSAGQNGQQEAQTPEQSEAQPGTEPEVQPEPEPEADPSEYVILRSVRGDSTGIYEYDKKGNNVKITYYGGADQEYDGYEAFDYDGAGQVIEYREYSMYDELWERHTYSYDDAGNMTEDIWWDDEEPYERYTYEYDETGKLFREIRFSYIDEEYEVFSAWEYRYDENGVLTQVLDCNDDFTAVRYYENYIYDENGHLSRTESYSFGSDRLSYFRQITCNERGEMIRDEWYMAGGTTPWEVDEYSYTYDEYDRLIEKNGTTYEYGPMPTN